MPSRMGRKMSFSVVHSVSLPAGRSAAQPLPAVIAAAATNTASWLNKGRFILLPPTVHQSKRLVLAASATHRQHNVAALKYSAGVRFEKALRGPYTIRDNSIGKQSSNRNTAFPNAI